MIFERGVEMDMMKTASEYALRVNRKIKDGKHTLEKFAGKREP